MPPGTQSRQSSHASPAPGATPRQAGEAPRLDTATLFAAGREVVIAHGEELYRLRLTRQNRLILTK